MKRTLLTGKLDLQFEKLQVECYIIWIGNQQQKTNDLSDWRHCDQDDFCFQVKSDEETVIKVYKTQ